jgi:hypothetical protein
LAETTDAPLSSAFRIRVLGVGGEQLCRNLGITLQLGAAYGHADQLDRRTDPGGQVVGLLVQEPDHLAAD